MNVHDLLDGWGGIAVGLIVGVLCGLGVGLILLLGLWLALPARPGTEFLRTGNPALKLEVRRASTKNVDGWELRTTRDDSQGGVTYHVSPQVELSDKDVVSTGVHFEPLLPKPASRWTMAAYLWVISVALFMVWRRGKRRRWGVSSAILLLLGVGALAHGLTSTAPRFDQRGIWQVVIRFSDAGREELADLTAGMLDGGNVPTTSYPTNHLTFFIDGELTFVVPVWEQHTEGLYYLAPVQFESDKVVSDIVPDVNFSEEDAIRIAKGIVRQ